MSLTRFVKVGNISNLSDARYCAGMGVDLLGFRVIESQSNYMSAKQFQEIRGWITGPKIVAEIYGITDPNDIQKIAEHYRPDLLELGIEEFKRMRELSIPFILSVTAGELKSLSQLSNQTKPDYILIKGFNNEVGDSLPAPGLIELNNLKLEDIDSKYADWGIALNGSTEISPGLKSYDDLSEVLEKLDAL
jgi:phosphoribosylanthranilate isomerase